MRPNQNTLCEKVETLLIKNSFEDISEREWKIVDDHIQGCEQCVQIKSVLSNMRDSSGFRSEPEIALRPEILTRVHEVMKFRKRKKQRRPALNWQTVKNILGYRMPLYQPLAIMLFLIAINMIFTPFDKKISEIEDIKILENILSEKLSVVDNMFLVSKQNIGSNVREDSLITKYIVPTM